MNGTLVGRCLGGVLVASIGMSAMLAGCKAKGGAASSSREVELETRSPSPLNAKAEFQIDDDVALIDDDGAFSVDARVLEVGGKLIRMTEQVSHMSAPGWIPIAEAKSPKGTEPTAAKGYKLRIGSGRSSETKWLPSSQVFPAPWIGTAQVKVGETLYERRSGNTDPPTCVVTESPTAAHQSVMARCAGSDYPRAIARRDLVHSFTPATLSALADGDTVYFDKMHWAMVVGKSGPNVVIRVAGFAVKDKVVDVSRVQIVR